MRSIIEINNISKKYSLGHKQNRGYTALRDVVTESLKNIFGQGMSYNSEEFWALKDVSFEINRGDRIGIIGRNGAGKSTLLKILSRITEPTSGSIKIRGRVASLLEVGTGFHPELTGRENIYLNGAILGMSRKEIKSKFDEIVDFAETEKFLDTPVKRYSSGMYVRLAFSVAAHLEPEILIVDEVLAVGDSKFQDKCLGKMKDISSNKNVTLLFVSHNLNMINTLCNKGLLLENGEVVCDDTITNVISKYNNTNKELVKWVNTDKNIKSGLYIIEAEIYNGNNGSFLIQDDLYISIKIEILESIVDLVIGIIILDEQNVQLIRLNYNDFNDINSLSLGKHTIIFKVPKYTLATGRYSIRFDISKPFISMISTTNMVLNFELYSNSEYGNRYFVSGNKDYNSVVRPNWLHKITSYNE